jgi:energy-coupling factor transport system substrate-specific component
MEESQHSLLRLTTVVEKVDAIWNKNNKMGYKPELDYANLEELRMIGCKRYTALANRRDRFMNQNKLQARDFITIGIFTAILWVVQMVIMYLGFLSPFIVAGYAVLIPIVTGIPMMLYYARIEKFGMITITSVIVAILLFIFGMGLTGAPICIAAGLIADLIAKSGNYKSWKKTFVSYGVFSLWVVASYLPLVLTADSYKQSLLEGGYDASFVDTLFTLVTPKTYPVIIVICFISGMVGAVIGKAVVRKNFEKAGIV